MDDVDANIADGEDRATPIQRRGMRDVIVAQCFGCFGQFAFTSGVMLIYLSAIGVPLALIPICLALPPLVDSICRVFFAYVSDRRGRKPAVAAGFVLTCAGFVLVAAGPFVGARLAGPVAVAGIVVYSIGSSLAAASWFAILDPLVPSFLRGRFFGQLRMSWQICGWIMAAVLAMVLSEKSPVRAYQLVMMCLAAALAVRVGIFLRIPDLNTGAVPPMRLRETVGIVMRSEGYAGFAAYYFLLSLFTAACPTVFNLLEKDTLGFGDNLIVWMGNLGMLGAVLGFIAGGRIVDRFGTKPMFLIAHFGYGTVLLMFAMRGWTPVPLAWLAGAVHVLFGFVGAASSIAFTTELLALMQPQFKSMSSSLCLALGLAGAAISGFLVSGLLKAGVIREAWTLFGIPLSPYDAILLGFGGMVVLLVVTLGLVPSVLRKAESLPTP